MDANLSLNSHIANISKSANYHLFKIRRIRKDLTRSLTTVLINALVLSRIDYCSSLLYHLPNTSLSILNHIIRASIQTIFSINRFDHSITDSHQLISNWFPQKIRRIRKDLTRSLTTVLINALVLSRIDYCSSLLYHLPNTSLSILNHIIRASIQTIFSINRFDHSITDSHQLISNWFPQKKRSLLHLLSLAHKAIYYTSPPYLTSLLTLRRPLTSL